VDVDGTVVTFSEIWSCDDNEGGNCIALTKLDGKLSIVVVLFAVESLPTGKLCSHIVGVVMTLDEGSACIWSILEKGT
jgi:hypothetical protein